MDGNQNSQYVINFNAQQQQQPAVPLQHQDYAQFFLNQQSYINNINAPGMYNTNQSQSVDLQVLQRQRQQVLQQILNNPQQQPSQPNQQFLDQNLSHNMSQQLQQQFYTSSMQFQQQLQGQISNIEQLSTLQNNENLLHTKTLQFQTEQRQEQTNYSLVSTNANINHPTTSSAVQIYSQMQDQQKLIPAQHQQQFLQQPVYQKTQISQTALSNKMSPPNVKRLTNDTLMPSQYGNPAILKRTKEEKLFVNTNAENARILKEREEEHLAENKLLEEREKQRIQEELKRKKEEAKEFAESVNEKIKSFPEPIHFATCHTLSKVSFFLPFPTECASTSSSLPCFDMERANEVLGNNDTRLANYLSQLLVDTTDKIREIELKHEEEETNDIDSSLLTPLIQNILNCNSTAFCVETNELDLNEMEQAFGQDIQEAVKQVSMDADAATIAAVTASVFNSELDQSSHNHDADCLPSSSDYIEQSKNKQDLEERSQKISNQEQIQVRRQLASMGKQPKSVPSRKKRDMVESLYDSLTGYFDPSKERRRRAGRAKTSEEEEEENDENKPKDKLNDNITYDLSYNNNQASTSTLKEQIEEPVVGKFFEKKKKRPLRNDNEENRPATPTEIIQQREMEWLARQEQRQEKYRRRQNEEFECWNNDALAENESYCKFTSVIDQILDQIEESDIVQNESEGDVEIAQEFLIEKNQLEELRVEAQKLKLWRKINKVNTDRLVKLLTVLEKNIRDVLNENGSLLIPIGTENDDESDEAYREIMDERLLRSANASCVALTIMTSSKMPKQVLIEDTIERSIQLCKQYLQYIIYPSADASFKSPIKVKKSADGVKRRRVYESFNPLKVTLYSRMVDLINYFAELTRYQLLNDTIMVQLCSLSTPPFFVENVCEVQVASIKLLSTIFSKCLFLRQTILVDLLNSLYRLSTNRNAKNCYHLGNNQYISNFSVLILQIIQSTVKLPQHKTKNSVDDVDENNVDSEADDAFVIESYDEARRRAAFFLERFLAKCTAKSEDDYRRLFEQFLNDVLLVLYRPEWPVAEIMLTVLANLLIMYFRSKNSSTMLSLRVASLEYLGIITARLRKDRVKAESMAQSTFEQNRLDLIVKGIVYEEKNDNTKSIDEIDISHFSSDEKLKKLEQALIDYIVFTKGNNDVSVEYIITFYAAEWYRSTVLDLKSMKEKYLENEKQKVKDKKLERAIEKSTNMKEYILQLLDKKHLKKRSYYISRTGNVLIDSDAQWVVKYLALKKDDLSQSFDVYLQHVLQGFHPDLPVAVRAKAMKCLTQIVEVDPSVLMNPDVDTIVRDRLVDANAAVREAAFELIGKYLILKPELLNSFYSLLLNRIKDTAVAVRKRVIRILKEIVDKQPHLNKKPEILSRIVQRINDEEGVRKLCLETFQTLWFFSNREHEKEKLKEKVISMADVVDVCVRDGCIEHFETLIASIVKKSTDYETLLASRQIVDALIDYIISLDSKIADDEQKMKDIEGLEQNQLEIEKTNQARLLASLTTLSVLSKARPDLLVRHADVFLPYLSMQVSSNIELRVLNQMILMLEQIVPLMEHPSDSFLRALDSRLNDVVKDGGMVIIASSIACMSAAYERFRKIFPGICKLFITYLKYLSKLKQDMEENSTYELQIDKKPTVMRSLYTLGLAGRYFDFDSLLSNQSEYASTISMFEAIQKKSGNNASKIEDNLTTNEEKESPSCILLNQMFSVLLFFSKSYDRGICEKALISLGQLSAGWPDLLTRPEIKNMYLTLLNTDRNEYLKLKIYVLKNLTYFLNAEEARALKKNEQYIKERPEQKDDLKEMELSASGLSSSVIQIYWNAILNCYFHTDELVRIEAAQVVWQTLEQGLVTPGSSIPTLIAISTDPVQNIRIRIANLIKDIDTKYAGMVASKAVFGVRMAYRLHKKIFSTTNVEQFNTDNYTVQFIRGIRSTTGTLTELTLSNDIQSLLMGLYVSIRTNRQQRRSFLSAILRLFSETVKEALELNELSFIADNLAHFPYQVMDEPLYVIYQADSVISISGQNILSNFKAILLPSLKPKDAQQNLNAESQNQCTASTSTLFNLSQEDDEDFSEENLEARFPSDITKVQELREQSLPCFFLLHLKFYLMRMYGFTKDRIQEYSPSEAAKVYEKPMNRRNIAVFSTEALMRNLDEICKEDSPKVRQKLAQHFQSLFQMLLSLDKGDNDDEDELNHEITLTNVEEDSNKSGL